MTIQEAIAASGPLYYDESGVCIFYEASPEGDLTGRMICYPESAFNRTTGRLDVSRFMVLDQPYVGIPQESRHPVDYYSAQDMLRHKIITCDDLKPGEATKA